MSSNDELPQHIVPAMNEDSARFDIAADLLAQHYGKKEDAWKEIADVALLRRAAAALRKHEKWCPISYAACQCAQGPEWLRG